MSEGMTRTGFRMRTALIGTIAALTIAGFGMAADEAKAISPDDPEIKSSRSMVTVTGCKGAQVSIEARERDLISMHNAHRRQIGAPQLCVEPSLQRAAEAHARDMIARKYFSHTSPEGKTSGDRARAAGYTGEGMGENIASTSAETKPQGVFDLWMNSSGHRWNIEYDVYTEVGVASTDGAPAPADPNGAYEAYMTNSMHVAVFGDHYVPAPAPAPAPNPAPAPAPAPAPTPSMPEISGLRPAQGTTVRDRTPLAQARITAVDRPVTVAQIKVYVDGRIVRESYDASIGRMRVQLPNLREGKHTLKVTVAGGPSLKTATTRFTVR